MIGTSLAHSSRVSPALSDDIADRLDRNLARVDNLVAIYEQRSGVRSGRPSVGDGDLLRAAASCNDDVDDVVLALDRAGIESDFLSRYARGLYALMQRRHWIVHRADRDDRPGPGHHHARSIPLVAVRKWRSRVEPVCRAILAEV